MRLTSSEQQAVIEITREVFGQNARVWLFGSRVDDTRKGGDIDLYVEAPGHLEDGFSEAFRMNGRLQKCIGIQKIDIVARGEADEMKPIHQAARATGIRLI